MKFFIVAILLIFNNDVFSQSIIIKDSRTKKILPFVTILYDDGGTYSDENGVFIVPKELKKEKEINISFLGYEEKTLLIKDLNAIVYLRPKIEDLESVVINSESKKTIKLEKAKAKKSTIITKHLELITFVQPKKHFNNYLKRGVFYFDKTKGIKNDEEYDDLTAVVRVNFYNIKDDEIQDKIYASKIFKLNLLEKETIEVNFEKSNLLFNEKSFAIGLEFIETINTSGDIVDEHNLLRPLVTNRENDFYIAESFQLLTFKNDNKLRPLQIQLSESLSNKSLQYYLAFDLELIEIK